MKKAGIITIALVLVATGVILYYRSQNNTQKLPGKEQGTMVQQDTEPVKEYIKWKKHYI